MAASLNGRVGVSASSNGVLVVASRAEDAGGQQASWRDRNGEPIDSAPTEVVDYPAVRISPDGRMIAFVGASASRDIWARDLAGRVGMRVTTDNSVEMNPVWSPDSTRVAFASRDAELRWEIYERPVSGLTTARKLVGADGVGRLVPHEWSTDGRFLVYSRTAAGPDTGLWILPLGEPGAPPRRYLTDAFVGQAAALSPDGHWLAYVSNESGRAEVFVRTFPDPERGKKQVSAEGGSFPRWRRDGRELFYLDARNRVVAVAIQADGDLDIGRPTPLFEAGPVAGRDPARAPLDVTADGQRFLIVTQAATSDPVSLDVSVNWMRDVTREP
jgi:Tol biopolymer transport system component